MTSRVNSFINIVNNIDATRSHLHFNEFSFALSLQTNTVMLLRHNLLIIICERDLKLMTSHRISRIKIDRFSETIIDIIEYLYDVYGDDSF